MSSKKLLEGIKIIDMSRILAGPWATQILADYGDSEYRQDGDFIPFNKDRQNLNIK